MSDAGRNTHSAADIAREARRLLAEGFSGDEPLRRAGTVGHALMVLAPDGGHHSWFVPITVRDRLAGFFQFLLNGTFMRFSTFARHPGDFADCPIAADWLDHNRIRENAEPQRRNDETSGEPWLTYDRSPDRLVWSVPLTDTQGRVRQVYVAGKVAYVPPAQDTYG